MHSYLKAIGFSDIAEKRELDTILQDVIQNYDEKNCCGRQKQSSVYRTV